MTRSIKPRQRPDSAPLHENPIRRFREELRLDRQSFADLIPANVDSLRVWESGRVTPRAGALLKIMELARKNRYPLTIKDMSRKKSSENK